MTRLLMMISLTQDPQRSQRSSRLSTRNTTQKNRATSCRRSTNDDRRHLVARCTRVALYSGFNLWQACSSQRLFRDSPSVHWIVGGRLGRLDSVSFTGFVSFPRVSYDDHMALCKVYLQEILSCNRGDFTVYILYIMFTWYNKMEDVLPGGVQCRCCQP